MILEENKSLLLLVRPLLNLLLTCCTIIFSDPKHQVAIINFFKNQVAIKKSFLGQKFLSNSLLNLIRALLKVTGAQTEKAAIQITQKITASEDSSMQILHLWDDLPRLDSKESHYCELFFLVPSKKKKSWGGWGGVYYCELNITCDFFTSGFCTCGSVLGFAVCASCFLLLIFSPQYWS